MSIAMTATLICPRCIVHDGWRLQDYDGGIEYCDSQKRAQLRCTLCQDVIVIVLASDEREKGEP